MPSNVLSPEDLSETPVSLWCLFSTKEREKCNKQVKCLMCLWKAKEEDGDGEGRSVVGGAILGGRGRRGAEG